MLRKIAFLFFLWTAAACIAACGRTSIAAQTPSGATTLKPASQSLLPNLLVEAEGGVVLRRIGWSGFLPVGFGTAVKPGDMLRVGAGGKATVFCGDEVLWEESPKSLPSDGIEHGVPCQSGRTPRPWPDVFALRGETDNQLPYIIYPRNSALLNERPRLRWHILKGAGSYTVSLTSDDGESRAAILTSGSSLDWPAEWPPLKPVASYVLIVEGGNRRSDEDNRNHAGLGFWLLSAGEAATVRDQEARIRSRPVDPAAADLLIAELYLEHGLRAEAVSLLEKQSTANGASAIWFELGQAFLESGLGLEARDAMERAATGSHTSRDSDLEAGSLVGLGLAARLLNEETSAQGYFESALALYRQIGDTESVDLVNTMLKNSP